jgi:biotin synthase-like enzyme
MWYVLIGDRKLCIFCSQNRSEVENYQKEMVAKTEIVERNREYERGDAVN